MKYKCILVEDDTIVRSYMLSMDIWKKHSIEIIDVAGDGAEALEKMEHINPDLVVTDISMPLMNGIELIKQIREINQSTYILVLSCHDEFEYVKEAMKLGANEYILKNTFNEKKLDDVLANTVKSMERQKSRSKESFYDKQDLKFHFFNQLMIGALSFEKKEEKRVKADIKGTYVNSAVIQFCIKEWNTVKNEVFLPELEKYSRYLTEEIKKYCERYLGNYDECIEIIYFGEGNYCCFLDLSSERRVSRMQQQLIETVSIVKKCLENEEYQYIIGVSDICAGETNIRQAVSQARTMVKLNFYLDDSVLYYAGGIDSTITDKLPAAASELLNKMTKYLNEDNGKLIIEKINDVIVKFKSEHTSPSLVIKWLKELDYILKIERDLDFYNYVYTIDDAANVCKEYRERLLSYSHKQMPQDISTQMQCALSYIHEHYKEKISLKDVAEEVHMNATYFSSMFNKEMSIGYSRYILNIRMDTAKKLLANTNLKVKEVASKSGFYDYHYFARMFKSLNKCSPLDYRKENSNIN